MAMLYYKQLTEMAIDITIMYQILLRYDISCIYYS